jgi:hypothetical protein
LRKIIIYLSSAQVSAKAFATATPRPSLFTFYADPFRFMTVANALIPALTRRHTATAQVSLQLTFEVLGAAAPPGPPPR